MKQYLDLCNRVVTEGSWVENERTHTKCLTVINADMTYKSGEFPLLTTKKTFWKSAIAEMLCYIRGYDNAADFRKVGTKTWDANANLNEAWLNNPNRKGDNDLGIIYGAVGNKWPKMDKNLNQYNSHGSMDCPLEQNGSMDLLDLVYQDLKQGKDNRGEIWTFWNPGMFGLGALRPCMYSHHFSILKGKLYLNSTQRSADLPLGVPFNMVQVYVLLALMAQITGLEMGEAYHKIINAHFYEDQVEIFKDKQMNKTPFKSPKLHINPKIKTLEDIRTWVTLDDFSVEGYEHHEAIKYPFSV